MKKNREATKIRRKSELLATSKKFQKSLSKELNISSERVVDFSKNMAILGGVLFVGYTILDRFLEAKMRTNTKKQKPNKFDSLNKIILPMLALALQQGSVVLMKKARILLVEYLEEKDKQNV